MSKLLYIDFITDKIKINILYKNQEVLDEIKANSQENAAIPKVSKGYCDLFFPKPSESRPYTYCSVVLSADGKMAFTDNSSGPIIAKNNYLDPDGALSDFWILNVLRSYADGIIIGANTLKYKKTTSHIYDKELVEQRKIYLNKSKQPCSIIVSYDGTDIPLDHMIFDVDESEEYKVIIATSPMGAEYIKTNSKMKHIFIGPFNSIEEVNSSKFDRNILNKDYDVIPVIITGENNNTNSKILLYTLKKFQIEKLCVESPTFNWNLMKMGLLDEFFINYSMLYAGGNITPGYSMPFGHLKHPHADLLTLGIHKSSFMYTRQRLHYDINCSTDLNKYKY